MQETVTVLSVKSNPILMLLVSPPAALARARAVPGQATVERFHITLARLDDQGTELPEFFTLPAPPKLITLSDEVRLVDSGKKQACYVEVSAASKQELLEYVKGCEAALGLSFAEPKRVFHVTLTNAGAGDIRASIGAPWEFESQAI